MRGRKANFFGPRKNAFFPRSALIETEGRRQSELGLHSPASFGPWLFPPAGATLGKVSSVDEFFCGARDKAGSSPDARPFGAAEAPAALPRWRPI